MTGVGSLFTIGQLVEGGLIAAPQDGNHGEKHPTASDYVADGVPFVMASDLIDGRVDFQRCKKLPQKLADALRVGFAYEGDVLLSHKGTVGEVAVLRGLKTKYAMLTPQVTYYRVLEPARLKALWLFFAFKSPDFQMQLRRQERQSTRSYVGITAERELKIPICSELEQQIILDKLNDISKAKEQTVLRQHALTECYSRIASGIISQ